MHLSERLSATSNPTNIAHFVAEPSLHNLPGKRSLQRNPIKSLKNMCLISVGYAGWGGTSFWIADGPCCWAVDLCWQFGLLPSSTNPPTTCSFIFTATASHNLKSNQSPLMMIQKMGFWTIFTTTNWELFQEQSTTAHIHVVRQPSQTRQVQVCFLKSRTLVFSL